MKRLSFDFFHSRRVARMCWGSGVAALLLPCLDTIPSPIHFSIEYAFGIFVWRMTLIFSCLKSQFISVDLSQSPKSLMAQSQNDYITAAWHSSTTEFTKNGGRMWNSSHVSCLVPAKFDRNLQKRGSVLGCSMLMSPPERQLTSLLKLLYLLTLVDKRSILC